MLCNSRSTLPVWQYHTVRITHTPTAVLAPVTKSSGNSEPWPSPSIAASGPFCGCANPYGHRCVLGGADAGCALFGNPNLCRHLYDIAPTFPAWLLQLGTHVKRNCRKEHCAAAPLERCDSDVFDSTSLWTGRFLLDSPRTYRKPRPCPSKPPGTVRNGMAEPTPG